MITNGTRPAKDIYKVAKYQHFGAISVDTIPDFSLDPNISHPDQEADGAHTECTGYTVADILCDIFKQYYSADFSYAAARAIAGDGPGTDGASFHAAMDSLVGWGGLPAHYATYTAGTRGEQFVSDFNNWKDDLEESRKYAQNGVKNVLGNGDAFDSVLAALNQGRISVSIGSPWFPEWADFGGQSGILALPKTQYSSIWHNYVLKGKQTIGGVPYIIAKPHIGLKGDNGFVKLSREVINFTLAVPGSGALTIDPNAIRWVSLLGITSRRFPGILPFLPKLIKLHA